MREFSLDYTQKATEELCLSSMRVRDMIWRMRDEIREQRALREEAAEVLQPVIDIAAAYLAMMPDRYGRDIAAVEAARAILAKLEARDG